MNEEAEQQIRNLPAWARVAVIARCAERALPLVTLRENTSTLATASIGAVRQAVESARQSALTSQPSPAARAEAAASVARQAHPSAQRAESAAGNDNAAYARAKHLFAGAYAASAAANAARVASASGADLDACDKVLSSTYDAVFYLSGGAADFLGPAVLDDISWFQKQSSARAVSQEFFNRPLWPLGEPSGWVEKIEKAGGSAKCGCSVVAQADVSEARKTWWQFWK